MKGLVYCMKMHPSLTHGEIVKYLIRDNKTNVADMATKTGINRSTIYSIINQNQKKLKPDVYTKIADYFGISPDVFFAKPLDFSEYTNIATGLISSDLWFDYKNMLKAHKRTYEFVHSALILAGYDEFTLEDVIDIIEKGNIPTGYTYSFGCLIRDIIIKGYLVNKNEINIIYNYRILSEDEQKLIEDVLNNFIYAHKAKEERRRPYKQRGVINDPDILNNTIF